MDFNKIFDEKIYLIDSATTHTILRNKRYFSNSNLIKAYMNTISGSVDLIKSTRRSMIILTKEIKLVNKKKITWF